MVTCTKTSGNECSQSQNQRWRISNCTKCQDYWELMWGVGQNPDGAGAFLPPCNPGPSIAIRHSLPHFHQSACLAHRINIGPDLELARLKFKKCHSCLFATAGWQKAVSHRHSQNSLLSCSPKKQCLDSPERLFPTYSMFSELFA